MTNQKEIEDRSEQEWASMLFNDKKHILDREKKIARQRELKRLLLLKRGLKQYE